MNLIRLLLIVLAVWIVLILVRQYRQRRAQVQQARRPPRVGTMVACEHCGLHVPEREAIRDDGHFYCSKAHRKAGGRPPGA